MNLERDTIQQITVHIYLFFSCTTHAIVSSRKDIFALAYLTHSKCIIPWFLSFNPCFLLSSIIGKLSDKLEIISNLILSLCKYINFPGNRKFLETMLLLKNGTRMARISGIFKAGNRNG